MLEDTIDGGIIWVEGWIAGCMHEEEKDGGYNGFEVIRHVCATVERNSKGAERVVQMLAGQDLVILTCLWVEALEVRSTCHEDCVHEEIILSELLVRISRYKHEYIH
jgi:hypothetical protein